MADRFATVHEALERGDVDLAAELELAQRQRRSDFKGPRDLMVTRLPTELAERVKDLAERAGMSYSETLALIVHKFFSESRPR